MYLTPIITYNHHLKLNVPPAVFVYKMVEPSIPKT